MIVFLQQALNALSLGATYALLALGLAIVFTIFGLTNFAHGELITICCYAALGSAALGLPWAVGAVAGVAASIVAALVMERVAFRPVRSASETTSLLTSFGVSLIIQALIVMLISARSKTVPQWDWLMGSWSVGALVMPRYQIVTISVTAIALLVGLYVLKRTGAGLAMRATAEDAVGARLVGVRINRVVVAAFAASGLLAGLAGLLTMARTGGSINPHMGLMPMLSAFVAVVVGGLGSLGGAVIGGFALGAVEVALRAALPASVVGLTQGFIFAAIAAVLVLRPQGLLGRIRGVKV
ncbi:MAG: hypothetical protein BGO26_02780 [Actinobacteria bacterium 69-20]|nr:branched-chain amino acid ABC transporter permease [Actinomycetota bacterium]OJV30922.1 MAG: hypothetical protein BGO26_02780 [Actinobacteria bacterium 69-20]